MVPTVRKTTDGARTTLLSQPPRPSEGLRAWVAVYPPRQARRCGTAAPTAGPRHRRAGAWPSQVRGLRHVVPRDEPEAQAADVSGAGPRAARLPARPAGHATTGRRTRHRRIAATDVFGPPPRHPRGAGTTSPPPLRTSAPQPGTRPPRPRRARRHRRPRKQARRDSPRTRVHGTGVTVTNKRTAAQHAPGAARKQRRRRDHQQARPRRGARVRETGGALGNKREATRRRLRDHEQARHAAPRDTRARARNRRRHKQARTRAVRIRTRSGERASPSRTTRAATRHAPRRGTGVAVTSKRAAARHGTRRGTASPSWTSGPRHRARGTGRPRRPPGGARRRAPVRAGRGFVGWGGGYWPPELRRRPTAAMRRSSSEPNGLSWTR